MNSRKDLSPILAELQRRGSAGGGKTYWRTLEELAESAPFQELMKQEFPEQADVWPDSLSRRRFLALMGASLALANLPGCSVRPAAPQNIVPYVHPPKEGVPGKPLFFATAMTFAGSAVGLLVESHLGRPTKIEGNPDHPASLGATSIFNQASILTLYDPDRSQMVTELGRTRTWDDALAAIRTAMRAQVDKSGAGLRILSEGIISPTLARQRDSLLKKYPSAKWHVYEPCHPDNALRAGQSAYGKSVDVRYDFRKADVVVSLDADFLNYGPGHLRYAADFMARRRAGMSADAGSTESMNRLYIVETAVSSTGAKADHRLATHPSAIVHLARDLAAECAVTGKLAAHSRNPKWITAVAKDLQAHRGRSVVLAGDRQPPEVHLLAHALNQHLGNVGETVFIIDAIDAAPVEHTQSLKELTDEMGQGKVELLFILGANPVYSAPADFEFTKRLEQVPLRFHLGLYQDETARYCHWHLPEAHYLEAWGDARAFDGTASIVQPLIEPLYRGHSSVELVSLLATLQEMPGYEIVRGHWKETWEDAKRTEEFRVLWETALHDGVIAGSAYPALSVQLATDWQQKLEEEQKGAPATRSSAVSGGPNDVEILLQPDPTIHDGSFANNGWLQELPKPMTTLTWDNAVLMSPATAQRLQIAPLSYAHGGEHGGYHMPVVELRRGDLVLRGPAWIMPGHADACVTLYLGHGRTAAGKVGGTSQHAVGFDAYGFRTAAEPWFSSGVRIEKTTKTYLLACTQAHHLMENRSLVRSATLAAYRENPHFVREEHSDPHKHKPEAENRLPTLYEPMPYEPPIHKWGMSIDLTSCIGCQACVIACQAENNIPIVGKVQVSRGREMHWIRVDRYVSGPLENPEEFHFQPLPCMHCENAPCEYVCPVAATVHSAEGLNDMVYNRCVGTRFCSNNCPYKVRRFNFLHYSDFETPSRRLQYNPEVTVRSRGVMEKCTYCVQRIRQAEITAQREERSLVEGEVLTACQAVCPASAITFGDLNDPQSAARKAKDSPLNYGLLEDLNTSPRTTYLAALRNPNPELEGV